MTDTSDKRATFGETSLIENNVIHQKITDPFKIMIRRALNAQYNALLIKKGELEVWDLSAQRKFKESFGITSEKARKWILDGINKEIELNQSIPISNFIKSDKHVYAFVNGTDLEHIVNIGTKFSKAPLTGNDSQVVTLCHEMSHFDDILGTEDLGENSPRNYAKSLARHGDDRTMQNSYNFEMYFI